MHHFFTKQRGFRLLSTAAILSMVLATVPVAYSPDFSTNIAHADETAESLSIDYVASTTTLEVGDTVDITVRVDYTSLGNGNVTSPDVSDDGAIVGIDHFHYYDAVVFNVNDLDIPDANLDVLELINGNFLSQADNPTDTTSGGNHLSVNFAGFPATSNFGYDGLLSAGMNSIYQFQLEVDSGATLGATTLEVGDGGNPRLSKNLDEVGATLSTTPHDIINFTIIDPPNLTSFTSSTGDGTYQNASSVNITATYDKALDSTSTMDVVLDTGATVTLAPASDGDTTMVGTYNPVAGENSADLTVSSITSESAIYDLDNPASVRTTSTVPTTPNNIADTSAIVISTANILVEFTDATASDVENTGGNLPSLTVQGSDTTSFGSQTVVVTAGGTATGSGTDYTLGSTTLTIPAADYTTAQVVSLATLGSSLAITGETLVESDETITLTLGTPDVAVTIGDADGSAVTESVNTYTITNDDTVTVEFNSATYASPAEGDAGSANMNLTLDVSGGEITSGETIDIDDLLTGTATAGGTDYTFTDPTVVTIPAADYTTPGTVVQTISIAGDLISNAAETAGETINLQLNNPSANTATGAITVGTQSTATVTITDDDAPGVAITSSSPHAVTEGGATATLSVQTNSTPSGTGVVVACTASEVTITPASLTYTVGKTPQNFTITADDDAILENLESETITCSVTSDGGDGDYTGLSTTGTTDITDDDATTVSMAATTSAADETGPTNGVFTGTLDTTADGAIVNGTGSAITVTFGMTGTATEGTDYTAVGTTFTIADGASSGTVTVVPTDDVTVETDPETAILTAASTDNVNVTIGTAAGTVNIADNDTAGFTILPATLAITEGGTAGTLTVVLTAQPETNVVIDVSTDDVGAATVDGGTTTALTFTNGDWNVGQTVSIVGVADVDGTDETPTISAVVDDPSSDNFWDPLANETTAVTVTDNMATVELSAATGTSTDEVTADNFFVLLVTGEVTSTVTVDLQDDGSGTATSGGTDYTFATPQTISIPAGSYDGTVGTAVAITAPTIASDTTDEDNETVDFSLTNALAGFVTLGAQTSGIYTITDDDNPPSLTFTTTTTTTADETAGTELITVDLSAASGKTVTVPFSVGAASTATETNDFTLSASPLTFAPGSVQETITLTRVVDVVAEPNETVILDLGIPTNASLGANTAHTVTITDDDGGSTVVMDYTGFITETSADDGTVQGSIVMTLTDETFGATLVDGVEVTVSNVPPGLTAVVTRDSSTQATLTFTGTATSHAVGNSIGNLTVTYANAAFTGGDASAVSGGVKNNLAVTYIDAATDTDNDNINDLIEVAGYNNGNINSDNDNIPDTLQPHVASVENTVSTTAGDVVGIEVQSGCDIQSLTVGSESGVGLSDSSFDYPLGLATYTLNCATIGSTVNVRAYFEASNTDTFTLRKANGGVSSAITPVSGPTLTTINGTSVIVVEYQVTDGGVLDTDGLADGNITDPVGLAAVVTSSSSGGGGGGGGGAAIVISNPDVDVNGGASCAAPGMLNLHVSANGSAASQVIVGTDNSFTGQDRQAYGLNGDEMIIPFEYSQLGQVTFYTQFSSNTNSIRSSTASETITISNDCASVPTTSPTSGNSGSGFVPETLPASSAIPAGYAIHDLVKAPNDGNPNTYFDTTVYYVGADNRRHAFPDGRVYGSWFCNFDPVREIDVTVLGQMPIGNNVMFRPGTQMVTFQTTNDVYAVDDFGVLHWVPTEGLAAELYGSAWNENIMDIQDVFIGNYTFGPALTSAADFNSVNAENSSVWPSSLFNIPGYLDSGAPECSATAVAPSAVTVAASTAPAASESVSDHIFTLPLSPGDNGAEVLELQNLLLALGFFPGDVTPNGNYGPATTGAVRAYQAARGIDALGIVGPSTRASLNAE